jgi:hypothetical protein
MLPDKIKCKECINEEDGTSYCYLVWNHPKCANHGHNLVVLDTEFLHLCWMVEETLNEIESAEYAELLRPIAASYKLLYHASWQHRVVVLAKMKGIEI